MSNEQWNQGQRGEWAPQQPEGTPEQGQPWTQPGQQSASEWGTAQAPAPRGNSWTEPQPQRSAQDWTQAQPQPSAGDWHQAQGQPQQQGGAQDWTQQQPASAGEWAQQYQGSAQEWNQQQDWTQQQQQWPAQQQWDQNQQQGWDQNQQWGQQQGYVPAAQSAGQPQWAPAKPKKPSPFDFSFAKPALPDAADTIFLLGTVGIGVWWLFKVISAFIYVIDFPLEFLGAVIGNAGLALFGVMALRTLLEVGVAVLRKPADKVDDGSAEDTTAV